MIKLIFMLSKKYFSRKNLSLFFVLTFFFALFIIEKINNKQNNEYEVYTNIQNKIKTQYSNIHSIGDCFIFQNNKLVYWSNQNIPISKTFDSIYLNNFSFIGNGYYIMSNKKINDSIILYAKLLKHENRINNKYLNSDFEKEYKTNQIKGLKITQDTTSYPIYLKNKIEFYLDFSESNLKSDSISSYISCILFFGIFFLLTYLLFSHKAFRNYYLKFSLFLFLILIKQLLNYYSIPNIVYNSILFSPFIYAGSSFLSSLGEIIVFLLIINGFINSIEFNSINAKIKQSLQLLIIPLNIINVLFIQDILINSNINISIQGIINFEPIVYICHFVLIFSQYIFLFIIAKLLNIYTNKFLTLVSLGVIIASSITVLFFIKIDINIYSKIFVFLTLLSIHSILLVNIRFKKMDKKLISIIILVIIQSIFIGIFVFNYNENDKKQRVENSLKRLSQNEDPETELLLMNLEKEITKDSTIEELIKKNKNSEIEDYLKKKFLKPLNNNYHIGVIACDINESIILSPNNTKHNCRNYFLSRISNAQKIDESENIFSEGKIFGENGYISLFNLVNNKDSVYLFIDCVRKRKSNEMSYPDLLLDEKNMDYFQYELKDYSQFYNNELVYQYGNSSYPEISKFKPNSWYKYNNKDLYILQDGNTKIKWVALIKSSELIDFLSFTSYMFLLSIIIIGLVMLIVKPKKLSRYSQLNIATNVEITIIGIFILSFFVFGSISLKYYSQMNLASNKDVLLEKTQSISFEIEKYFNEIPNSNEEFEFELNDLSNAYLTDINLYDTNGYLINSSRNGIFDNKLISELINPEAFKVLKTNRTPIYLFNENIGKRDYIASYIPIKNKENKNIAYLHIPFIIQQKNLEQKINQFVTGYSNLFILWIIMSILIAYLLSKFITSPLRKIKELINRINLKDKNEKINIYRNDELGDLIRSYNDMVDKLEESAKELQKSEREHAWRELAKQVAHDIKNPLTPMKLSLQQLQRLQKKDIALFHERFEQVSNSLIDQIATLSDIANEFSDYSKSNKNRRQISELNECISHVVDIYKTKEKIDISIINNSGEMAYVVSDKQQIIRIFNNLIKNSIQAIESDKKGIIQISINQKDQDYLIKIKDNGIGISSENQKMIFSNEFTTKKDGTGIGLSIVKSLIESIGGSIEFNSQENIGTEFIIRIPKLNSQK